MAEAASVTVSIPAQSLVGALRAFAEQSGVQVLYEPSLVEGKRAAAVNGAMESNDALSRLLRGSGLLYQVDNGTVLLLAPPPDDAALELGTTSITGTGLGRPRKALVPTPQGVDRQDAPVDQGHPAEHPRHHPATDGRPASDLHE
ncbi:STN domain-containing protein [Pseudomonas sp. JUb96]|uniref:STN domain-containing protein n=1 Tax=Pseudomonas sp. JUb96 TaxID=2940539 RepID=UPI0022269BC2|nr:STN domain-containing protein [Pseudomonas sp. JUb96]MCW2270823.1 hypothetical protein [Pseudomonas sp. JUb96]